ncbi:hypothetical protein [Xanthomonas maliensis]|uniref:hypothetical protein n=1 Tax=Xanthomonas maliensis TaxID=1321368 RepID=UPI001FD56052|nr:hypothetical protein [Xanthomonas maliensis]
MTPLKARRKRRRRSATQRVHDRDTTSLYAFGATLEQIDRFYTLLRTISALEITGSGALNKST